MERENLLHRQDDRRAIFKQYFPSGVFIPLKAGEVNAKIKKRFSVDFLEEKSSDYFKYFAIYHKDQSITYVGTDIGEFGIRQITFVDKNKYGITVGESTMLTSENPNNPSDVLPFVYSTYTNRLARRKGLGLRRLEIMNAFAHIYHNRPLHSKGPSEAETGVWQKLVGQRKENQMAANLPSFRKTYKD